MATLRWKLKIWKRIIRQKWRSSVWSRQTASHVGLREPLERLSAPDESRARIIDCTAVIILRPRQLLKDSKSRREVLHARTSALSQASPAAALSLTTISSRCCCTIATSASSRLADVRSFDRILHCVYICWATVFPSRLRQRSESSAPAAEHLQFSPSPPKLSPQTRGSEYGRSAAPGICDYLRR